MRTCAMTGDKGMEHGYRITPESRAENLDNWTDEELWTLHERLMNEVGQNLQVVEQISEIILKRTEAEAQEDERQ